MRISFRADASLEMGTGHVMRCLTLAYALREKGHVCEFICRDLQGHLGERIQAEGFDLTFLPKPAADFHPAPHALKHAALAHVSWEIDARETHAALHDCNWMIVDHYAFDAKWRAAALTPNTKLAVIDDLADRHHIADLLIDQNLGRRASDYDAIIPKGAERLIGPRYALLRPEFYRTRKATISTRAARISGSLNVLVAMGGVDLHNATGMILDVLGPQPNLAVTVVMGANAPALETIRTQAAKSPNHIKVIVDTKDIAGLMASADIAIGAAGGSSWERCALGLPTVLAILADNQIQGTAALHHSGAAIDIGSPSSDGFTAKLKSAFDFLRIPSNRAAMSQSAAKVADGNGVKRVVAALETPIKLNEATLADAPAILDWRNAVPAELFVSGTNPNLKENLVWFQNALKAPNRKLYVAGTPPFAHLRLDLGNKNDATVSILLAPQARGAGYGVRLLSLLCDQGRILGLERLLAKVRIENAASIALFSAAQFSRSKPVDGFYNFVRDL